MRKVVGVTVTVAHCGPAVAVADNGRHVAGVAHHHVHKLTHVYGTPLSLLFTAGDRPATGFGNFNVAKARRASCAGVTVKGNPAGGLANHVTPPLVPATLVPGTTQVKS
jgi:hypothetical protein